MKTIGDIGPAKLLDGEIDAIREAADTLLFSEDPHLASVTVAEIEALARDLVESERWIEPTAEQLVRDIEACGPEPVLA
jgi:hypothetical protein